MAAYAPTHAPSALPADVRLLQATAQAVLWLAGLAALALLMLWAARLPGFALRGIVIESALSRTSESTLRANAAPKLQGNFLTMDLQAARAAFESVPWVRRAVVRRVWPMRLAVQLEEHQPAALWGEEGGNDRLVNRQGEVFDANVADVDDDALPRLAGPDGTSAQMLALLQRLGPVLAPLEAGDIEQLTLSPRGSWRVLLDKGAALELGRGSDDVVLARTAHFVQTMPRVSAAYQRALLSADLRHLGGFAVRLKGITTTNATNAAAAAEPAKRR